MPGTPFLFYYEGKNFPQNLPTPSTSKLMSLSRWPEVGHIVTRS